MLQRPLVTEKVARVRASANQYVFRADLKATKPAIREIIETLFKVDVVAVNTLRVPGKFRRLGSSKGNYRPDWKKVIVTLKKGQEIKTGEESAS